LIFVEQSVQLKGKDRKSARVTIAWRQR
jgi:hypothetical protein